MPNLLRTVRTLSVLLEPGSERDIDGIEKMGHAHGLSPQIRQL
jgi:hypothetical protein